MDTVVTDVVSTTATKFSLDKRFLIGVAAGITVSAAAVGTVKLKQKIEARREAKKVADTAE